MPIKEIAKNLGGVISKNSPSILTGMAVGGLISTAVLAVKATPKAFSLLNEEWDISAKRRNDKPWPWNYLSVREVIRITWKCYVPAVGVAAASIACIIGANHISLRRSAALASVYTVTEAAFREYQAKVAETIGRNKELKVRDEVSADRVKTNPPSTNEIIITGKGEVLCLESLSGRYFKSNIEQIRRVINDSNHALLTGDNFISLNELYYDLGLKGTDLGDLLGWDLDKQIAPNFSTTLTDEGEPCIVLNFEVKPKFI